MKPETQTWLEHAAAHTGAIAGTVHYPDEAEQLHLAAQLNIPPHVLDIVRTIPKGKGMAGYAQVSRAPVQSCNLGTDSSGKVRAGAKDVGGKAAIAWPVFDGSDVVRAIVGLTFPWEGEVSEKLASELQQRSRSLP
jgi:L-methionine (R)-S-oxide reductase